MLAKDRSWKDDACAIMSDPFRSVQQAASHEGSRVLRARSVPSARPFLVAVIFWALHFLGLLGSLTALYCMVTQPSQLALRLFLVSLGFSVLTWLVAFFKRRAAHCPLCKGTPLMNSGALPHVRAWRIPPFNHGVSAVFSILATQTFRCMYCGSEYDLLKPSARLHGHRATGPGADHDPPPHAHL